MKKFAGLYAFLALAIASLACQTVMGGGSQSPVINPPVNGMESTAQPELPAPTQASGEDNFSEDENNQNMQTEFPMPDGAFNVVNMGGALNFQVKMPLGEAMKFYLDEFTKQGYTERADITFVTDSIFSMVFDGHPSGKAIIIQGVDFGDGSININISLQDL